MEPNWSLQITAEPAEEPVTPTELKAHCRVDISDDDDYITALGIAARIWVENHLGRKLITQTGVLRLDSFPCSRGEIVFPYSPVSAVASIAYLDSSGASATLSASLYTLDPNAFKARIYPAYGQLWPVAQCIQNAVTITHTLGYGAAAAVPASIKHAIKLLVGQYYESRENIVIGSTPSELPKAVDALLAQEKSSWL